MYIEVSPLCRCLSFICTQNKVRPRSLRHQAVVLMGNAVPLLSKGGAKINKEWKKVPCRAVRHSVTVIDVYKGSAGIEIVQHIIVIQIYLVFCFMVQWKSNLCPKQSSILTSTNLSSFDGAAQLYYLTLQIFVTLGPTLCSCLAMLSNESDSRKFLAPTKSRPLSSSNSRALKQQERSNSNRRTPWNCCSSANTERTLQ